MFLVLMWKEEQIMVSVSKLAAPSPLYWDFTRARTTARGCKPQQNTVQKEVGAPTKDKQCAGTKYSPPLVRCVSSHLRDDAVERGSLEALHGPLPGAKLPEILCKPRPKKSTRQKNARMVT